MRKTRKNAAAASNLGLRKETLRSLSVDQLMNVEGASNAHQGQLTYGKHFTATNPAPITVGQ